jgi:hypothetical protein
VQTGFTQSACTGDATSRSMTAAREVDPKTDGLLALLFIFSGGAENNMYLGARGGWV